MKKDTLFKALKWAIGTAAWAVVGFFIGDRRGRKKGYSEALRRYQEANEGLDEEPAPPLDPKLNIDEKLETIVEQYIEPEEKEELEIDFGGKADILEEEITSYTKPKKNKGRAYEITLDEAGSTGYPMVSVFLYRNDATLTESDGETVIQNWKEIGADVIRKLIISDEHDRAYTRNDISHVDYEIVALDEAFNAEEGGLQD